MSVAHSLMKANSGWAAHGGSVFEVEGMSPVVFSVHGVLIRTNSGK
jgi:hypothetical protein